MICFQIARTDTTTRAVAVVSSVVTVHGERPPAIYTPDTVHPVNLGGVHLFVSNVTPFASHSSFSPSILQLFVLVSIATTSWLVVNNIDSLSAT